MPIFLPDHFATLLSQARAGSRDALGRLLDPFRMQLLLGRQNGTAPGQLDPMELLQETYRAAIAGFDLFVGNSEGELFTWLRQIMDSKSVSMAHRYSKAQKRDVRRQVSLDEQFPQGPLADLIADPESTPYTSTSKRERRILVERAFQLLKPHHQEVVRLHHAEGRSFAEIATLLGKSPAAVAKSWQRALESWRAVLQSLGVEDS